MTNIEKVNDYLTKAGTFYMTTVDNDKPKCRPIGFKMVVNDKLYFGVGTFKEVYAQMTANTNVEICACIESSFLRYYGQAVVDTNPELIEKAFEVMPFLKDIYSETTGNKLALFSLENAVAEFRGMMGIEEKITF